MITANDILKLLAAKHSEDVFIKECKDGPTHGRSHNRPDAWAMKKSWSLPIFWGYEIKVTRSDFINDTKWMNYLPLCSDFYFVSPPDIIWKEEVPEKAGLLWCSKNCKKLITKKKAPHRNTIPDTSLLLYILMQWGSFSNAEYWEMKLREKEINYAYGHNLGRRIGKRIKEEILAVRDENRALRLEHEQIKHLKDAADRLNIPLYGYTDYDKKLIEAKKLLDSNLFSRNIIDLKQLSNVLNKAISIIELMEKQNEEAHSTNPADSINPDS
jgi:hypothetical protein